MVWYLRASKIEASEVRSPSTTVIYGLAARDCAFADLALRVRARIVNGVVSRERMASMTALPCLPVAPVMRIFLVGIIWRGVGVAAVDASNLSEVGHLKSRGIYGDLIQN